MKSVLIITLVAGAMIGVMVPNVFAQSIVDEKDCKIIGEELDSNIECRYLLKTPEGHSIDLELDQGSARYYDQEKNILYFGERWNEVYDEEGNRIEVTLNAWKHNYVGVELDTLTIVDQLHCEPIITGTYEKIVTYPCELELEIESKDHKLVLPSKRDWIDHPNAFVQYEENVIFAETYYAKGDRSYAIALFDYNGNKIRWLHDEPSHAKAFGEPNRANIDALIVSQTKTTTPYIYYVIYGDGKSHSKTGGLHVMQGEKPFSILHSYNTDLKFGGKIFLNEEKNQVYYFVDDVMYKIKGMGELKPTGIASFVDQSKDPQHYLDRYNNEPSYKQWFDENYSQYSSIYEAVGLDQEDYELKIKANDVRKLINENYVPTSSELGSKWLWVSSGGTDGYTEYCLTLNCDGYSHTTYRPVRDVVNWDQHLELTILFFEDGDNSFDTHTEIQCEDESYFDCGRVYPNYQCTTPNANYDLREAKRNLTCQSEYFNIIVNEKKTDCDERSLGCGDFENHSADMMKVVLEKIARNSNVELTNNVESTIAHTPEPEYVPEPAFTPEPVIEQEVNCGPGTESVNGICEVIQTVESEEGGGCLIATATYGSELAPQVQQLRELRDNQLLQTESGTAFMTTFNDIYYSFSPTIADMEREHPMFKEIIKLAITPMISSLSLMENAESESEVLGIGISVIMLNLAMYLGIPAIVVVGIRKKF